MSASMDKADSTDPGGGSREVLVSWLETHAAGECDAPTMQRNFLDACRRHPDAPWDALALLDQYQRRGKLEPPLAAALKKEIAQMVFGVRNPGDTAEGRPPLVRSAPPVTRRSAPPSAADPFAGEEPDDEEDEDDEDEKDDVAAADAAEPPPTRTPAPAPRRIHVPPAPQPAEESPPVAAGRPQVSSVLRGRYELHRVLGRGADGVVYRALDRNRRHLGDGQRHVAIKVLHADLALAPEVLIDVQRRAHQAQMLLHPHIARVHDFDHENDVHFIVMELVQGELLEMLLQSEQRYSIGRERALKIISDTASALTYAHEHGVIMGNLTPRKLMMTSGGDVKLIDVGFPTGRHLADDSAEDMRSRYDTRYASLERVQGEPVTTSDDVYSLACIAYELLTGRHPYEGQSGAAARVQARKPDRIAALLEPQWQALERALRVSRSERDITIAQLRAALTSSADATRLVDDDPAAIRAPRREPDEPSRASHGSRWIVAIIVLGLVAAAAWYFIPPAEREQLTENIADVAQATISPDVTRSEVQALPPTTSSTSRAIESGAMPVESATTGSAEPLPAPPAPAETVATEPAAVDASPPAAASARPAQPASSRAGSGVIGFPKHTYVVRESEVVVRIPVTRVRGTRGAAAFQWSVQGNTAEAGEDFAAIGPDTERMAAGQASTVLHIPLVSDSRREGTEMFTVQIEEVTGAARAGELTRATVIIVDDD